MDKKFISSDILGTLDGTIGHGTTVDGRVLRDLDSMDTAELLFQIEHELKTAGVVLIGDLEALYEAADKGMTVPAFVRNLVDHHCTEANIKKNTSTTKSGFFRALMGRLRS